MASIPQRFGRIALHKFHEFKRRIEDMDEDALRELEAEQQQNRATDTAKRELDDSIAEGGRSDSPSPAGYGTRTPDVPSRPRTPEQIAAGVRPNSSVPSYQTSPQPVQGSDPLAYHYQLLGVENGSDLMTVESAYKKLAARCDPARFPADSDEAKQAVALRERLDASYKILRETLDFTARRFDLLEFDPANAPVAPQPSRG